MESDLRLQLEWVAVTHFNTRHPHAHVLLRGVAEGQELRLPSEYVKTGIRRHAEDLCTAQLRYRTAQDRAEARAREINQPRFTPFDFTLGRQNRPENHSPAHPDHFIVQTADIDPMSAKRLFVLASIGVAEPIDRFR